MIINVLLYEGPRAAAGYISDAARISMENYWFSSSDTIYKGDYGDLEHTVKYISRWRNRPEELRKEAIKFAHHLLRNNELYVSGNIGGKLFKKIIDATLSGRFRLDVNHILLITLIVPREPNSEGDTRGHSSLDFVIAKYNITTYPAVPGFAYLLKGSNQVARFHVSEGKVMDVDLVQKHPYIAIQGLRADNADTPNKDYEEALFKYAESELGIPRIESGEEIYSTVVSESTPYAKTVSLVQRKGSPSTLDIFEDRLLEYTINFDGSLKEGTIRNIVDHHHNQNEFGWLFSQSRQHDIAVNLVESCIWDIEKIPNKPLLLRDRLCAYANDKFNQYYPSPFKVDLFKNWHSVAVSK